MAAAGDAGRAGDSVANATHDLYRQYGKQIYAYCLHQLRSREEAEDAVQTTFLNAFRGLQRGTTTQFEQAWLYKIAQNVCIARRSSSGRRLRLEAPDDFEILEEIVPAGTASAADTLELMGLDDALEQMPENQRRAILLREWQGLSYREIASQLELSQGAVEMLIFRARRTLATALEEPAAAKRRTGKAKTGFSFGSLIAAMKGLFSTGAALKMAAVAVSAAVVSTNAVHTVVHRAVAHRHTRTAATVQQLQQHVSSAPVVVHAQAVELVSWTTVRRDAAAPRAPHVATIAGASTATGRKPVVVEDETTPGLAGPVTSSVPAASAPADSAPSVAGTTSSGSGSPAPPATHPTAPPPPPPPPTGGSGTGGSGETGGSGGQGGSGSTGGGHHHGRGGGGRTTTGSSGGDTTGKDAGKGKGRHRQSDATTDTTPTTTTTTTTSTTTTTTTTTTTGDPGDSSTLADASGSSAQGTDTSTTTTTTTTTSGDGGSSPPGPPDDGGHGHDGGQGHGGGHGGDGGNGNGGGNGGGGHHHGG